MSFWKHDSFVERLQECAGSPWTPFEAQQHIDALVLQPLPLSTDVSWSDEAAFLEFVSNTFHRRLLRCFIGSNTTIPWTLETLMKQTRPPSPLALAEALERCTFWQIAFEQTAMQTWQGCLRLASLNNLGWTLEWVIQALLERDHNALVRRHVILGEIADQGEMDVLALFAGGKALFVECKSSSKRLTNSQVDRFVAKAQAFPAARALLLIDTDDPHHMQQRMGQLGQAMLRAYGDASVEATLAVNGSSVVRLRQNLFVADTGGDIPTLLQWMLAEAEEPF